MNNLIITAREQCVKLFEDIVNAYKKDKLHFCGSVVYAPLEHKHGIDYYVIVDGQQRLTTIYLLIKALIDCAETESQKEYLSESVFNKDKFDTYDVEEASKLNPSVKDHENYLRYLKMEIENELLEHLRPASIEIVVKMPVTASGKIDYQALEKMVENDIL